MIKKKIEKDLTLANEARKRICNFSLGTTIYAVLRHVSKSSMTRHVSFFVMENNSPVNVSCYIGQILNIEQKSRSTLILRGTGNDITCRHLVGLLNKQLGTCFKDAWI